MSGVSCGTEETYCVRDVTQAAIAEVKSVHGEVESKVASHVAQAEASTAHIVGVLSERVKEVVAHLEVQASHVVDVITQQLEKGLEAIATSTAATFERHMRTTVEERRQEVQTQLE